MKHMRVAEVAHKEAKSGALVESVRFVLEKKGSHIWSVPPDASVFEAIALMAEKGVGALLVIADSQLVGIISERDYARKVILKGKSSAATKVAEIMTSPVVTARLNMTVDECLRIMTQNRIRHLPVQDGEKLVGVISIGDLVKSIIAAQAQTIDQLTNYISGKYPA
jgi:CBS domain-containing protein